MSTSNKEKLTSVTKMDLSGLNKVRPYMLLILSVAIIAGVVMRGVIPQFRRYKKIKGEIDADKLELQKVTAHAQYLQDLYNLQDQLQENIDLANQSVPVDSEVPYFLNQLLQVADNSGVEVDSLSFAGIIDPGESSELGMVKAQMSVEGSYLNILNFVRKLEASRRLVIISDLSLSLNVERSSENREASARDGYVLNLALSAYYMPKIDTEGVDIDTIVSKPRLESVIVKLRQMDHYEPADIDFDIGKLNPFVEENRGAGSDQSETSGPSLIPGQSEQ